MPRKPKEIKRPMGCPSKEIDWKRVDELLIAGCPGSKIADAIGIHPDTLYIRCTTEKGMIFSAYAQQKRPIGDSLLHEAQFKKALEGDNTMLVWLGKVRLNQDEKSSELKDMVIHELRAGLKQFSEESGSEVTQKSEVETKPPLSNS